MKNFVIIKITSDYLFASVDVRCGFLWLKHRNKKLFRHKNGLWKYLDNGKPAPLHTTEMLEAACHARNVLGS